MRSAAPNPTVPATVRTPTTATSGTLYNGRVATTPKPRALPSVISQVDLRTASMVPSAAPVAAAMTSTIGTRRSGETSEDVGTTCTSNGRVKGSPTEVTARAASARRPPTATTGTTSAAPSGRSAAGRRRLGATTATTAQTNEAAVSAAVFAVGLLSRTGSNAPNVPITLATA